MKKTTKILSILLALALVVTAFAACGKKEEEPAPTEPPATDSTDPFMELPSDNEEPTQKEEESSTKKNEQQPSKNQQTSKKPASSKEAFGLFNSLIGSQKLSCTSVKQKIATGTLGTKDKVFIDFSDPKYTTVDSEIAFREKFEKDSKNGAALSELSESDISKVSFNGNTLTITLKNRNASDFTGTTVNGYINVVDAARAQELGTTVKDTLPDVPGNVKIKSSALSLTGGKIVAVFNNDFTELESVKITYKENIKADFSYLLLTIVANLNYNITSEYK